MITIRILIIALIFLFVFILGYFVWQILMEEEQMVKSDISTSNPPTLMIFANKDSFQATLGTTSWFYREKDSIYTGYEADSDSPSELVKYQEKRINIEPNAEILLKFNREPMNYTVSIWDNDQPTTLEVIKDKLTIPEYSGVLIFVVKANWDEGTAYYAFSINVK